MSRVWVFDIDDTLYLERDYVQSGFRAVDEWARRKFGIEGLYEAAWALFLTATRNTTLTDAFTGLGRPLSSAETAEAISVYREHAPNIRLCSDAADFLNRVGDTGQIAIVTDGPSSSQRAKIDVLGLASLADPIVVTSEHGAEWHKPSPRPFRDVERQLAVAPEVCVYIADNPAKDFAGPKALGWKTVRITRGAGLHSNAPSLPGEIDLTVTSLKELTDRMVFV